MRTKTFSRATSILLFFAGIGSLTAEAAKPCTSVSPLSDDEAQILLYMTPISIAARQAGTDVDMERSDPTQQYPAAEFFVATLVSQDSSFSVLNNGILGEYAVNKHTGEVISMAAFTPVRGKALNRVRDWLLHAHCAGK
jgi:hypothetical protein